jgi:hypothetical protein
MTNLPTAERKVDVAASSTNEPSVLELAENREQFAPPQATKEIADWVNEGGAGGEVKR